MDSHAHAWALTDPDAYSHDDSNSDAKSHAVGNHDSLTDPEAYSHDDSNSDAKSHAVGNHDSLTDPDAYSHDDSDSDARSHAVGNPDSLIDSRSRGSFESGELSDARGNDGRHARAIPATTTVRDADTGSRTSHRGYAGRRQRIEWR